MSNVCSAGLSNNALQRTGEHRGRPVRAMNGVRGPGRNGRSCLAAELGR